MLERLSSFDDPGFSTESNDEQDTTTIHLSYIPETTTWHRGFRTHTEGRYVTDTGGIVTTEKLSEARAELYRAVSQFMHRQEAS